MSEFHIDKRIFFLMNEHKIYMQKRLLLLDSNTAKNYQTIITLSEILKNLCYKYNLKPSNIIRNNILTILNEIKEQEFSYLKNSCRPVFVTPFSIFVTCYFPDKLNRHGYTYEYILEYQQS